MMAVRVPLAPATNPLMAAYSPFTDQPLSPRPLSGTIFRANMSTPDPDKFLTAPPSSANALPSPQEQETSIAPSPITSEVGTEFADVDEAVEEESVDESSETTQQVTQNHHVQPIPVLASKPPLLRVDTSPRARGQFPVKSDYEAEPQSVIHAPQGFGTFPPPTTTATPLPGARPDLENRRGESEESIRSNSTVKQHAAEPSIRQYKTGYEAPMPPTPLQTSLPVVQDWSTTPRAQSRQDFGALSRPNSSLASISESDDNPEYLTANLGARGEFELTDKFFDQTHDEVEVLRNALSECWTLCNTLASLSYVHRARIFNFSGRGDVQEQAWKSCWRLCQNLYESRDEDINSTIAQPTLDLCREFCQALFEIRVRDNETADSVLRVSFELNNHLFNTHDRNLPEAFRERTLDFYIMLCHRLMKQKERMAEETDSLLRSCWSLTEMLFSMRQSRREGRKLDEELLGSAIQACWELCDLYREGWTQIRPERGTPRPSQTTFTQAYNQAKKSGFAPLDENGNPKPQPETPTTIFEDTVNTISPDEAPAPNILVLGAQASSENHASLSQGQGPERHSTLSRAPLSAHPTTQRRFWSSGSSVHSISGISDRINPTSAASADTLRTTTDDPVLTLLKTLFVKAALTTNRGYTQSSSDTNLNSLIAFAKTLPDTSFGTQVWQMNLLDKYRKTIASDTGFRSLGAAATIAERGRINAVEVARAVQGMTSCVYGFGWLRDLYRYVFGFYIEEALKGEDEKSAASQPAMMSRRPKSVA